MSDTNTWQIRTLKEQPQLADVFYPQKQRIWPGFMMRDPYANRLWHPYVTEIFDAFQLYLVNEEQLPVAVAQSIPLTWDGTMEGLPIGWNDCLVRGAAGYEAGITPDTLAALEIAIQPEYAGQGISYRMIRALRELAEAHGLQAVIVAVRPSWKARYPLAPMERYARWQRQDGTPFDPWLRAHWRSGGEILKVANPAFVAEGTIAEWEAWTGMEFPDSGDYVVPETLAPIQIDRAMNIGNYVEPNVWVHHPITTRRLLQD